MMPKCAAFEQTHLSARSLIVALGLRSMEWRYTVFLRYHHRVVALDNSRLVKLAMVDGCTLSTNQPVTAATNKVGNIM